jgi:hypothetical protein
MDEAVKKLWDAEPAVLVSLVSAILSLGVSFGLQLSAEQTGAILTVFQLTAGVVTRSQVSPTPPPPEP